MLAEYCHDNDLIEDAEKYAKRLLDFSGKEVEEAKAILSLIYSSNSSQLIANEIDGEDEREEGQDEEDEDDDGDGVGGPNQTISGMSDDPGLSINSISFSEEANSPLL